MFFVFISIQLISKNNLDVKTNDKLITCRSFLSSNVVLIQRDIKRRRKRRIIAYGRSLRSAAASPPAQGVNVNEQRFRRNLYVTVGTVTWSFVTDCKSARTLPFTKYRLVVGTSYLDFRRTCKRISRARFFGHIDLSTPRNWVGAFAESGTCITIDRGQGFVRAYLSGDIHPSNDKSYSVTFPPAAKYVSGLAARGKRSHRRHANFGVRTCARLSQVQQWIVFIVRFIWSETKLINNLK